MERNQSGKEEIVSINEMVREGSLARRHWRKDGKKVRERATWAQGEEQQDRETFRERSGQEGPASQGSLSVK